MQAACMSARCAGHAYIRRSQSNLAGGAHPHVPRLRPCASGPSKAPGLQGSVRVLTLRLLLMRVQKVQGTLYQRPDPLKRRPRGVRSATLDSTLFGQIGTELLEADGRGFVDDAHVCWWRPSSGDQAGVHRGERDQPAAAFAEGATARVGHRHARHLGHWAIGPGDPVAGGHCQRGCSKTEVRRRAQLRVREKTCAALQHDYEGASELGTGSNGCIDVSGE